MKFVYLFALVIFFSCFSSVYAADYPKPYDLYVNDFGKVLSVADTAYLRALFVEVRENTSAQVVFVSLDNLGGQDISQYAVELGQNWGVGNKDNSNGLIILYSKSENKIFVATGYGLEGILPDSKLGRLLDENYVPLRDSGNVSEGIVHFSEVVSRVLEENADEIRSGNSYSGFDVRYVILALVILLIFIFGVVSYFSRNRKKGFGDFLNFLFIDFLFRSIIWSILLRGGRGNNSGFGGGFGGGGFGGGGFGGGGAGR